MSNDVNTVLVFGTDEPNILMDSLFDAGYVPIVRGSMNEAISQLRHELFKAVIIQQDRIEADTLEFILNVRDLDEAIPVFVVGASEDQEENQVLSKQQNTFLVGEDYSELKKQIKKMFNN